MIKSFTALFPGIDLCRKLIRRRLVFIVYTALVCFGGFSVSFATDIDREPWHWSKEIPAAVIPPKPPAAQRDPRAFEHLNLGLRTTMKDLVARIGVPDAFAPQYCVTRTEGVPVDRFGGGLEAGTFRYPLRSGGEVFISVSNFQKIEAVIRYQKAEDHNVLYRRGEP